MRTSLIVLSLALFPLLACGQNARPVLADTNGVIRVGTVGSELTALNGTHVTTGTVAEARIDAALLRAATAATLYQGTNANLTTLGTLNGGALTNLNSTNLTGTVPTNVLPGALGTLSTWEILTPPDGVSPPFSVYRVGRSYLSTISDADYDVARTATIYIATNGNNANDGLSWDTPKQTLQGAISGITTSLKIYCGPGDFTLGTTNTAVTFNYPLTIICVTNTARHAPLILNNTNTYLRNVVFGPSPASTEALRWNNTSASGVFAADNVRFERAQQNGFSLHSDAGLVHLRDCGAISNRLDGFNYKGSAGTNSTCVVLEERCVGSFNGWSASGSNNGSTTHDNVNAVRLQSRFFWNEGRNVHDTYAGYSWNLGCEAGGSRISGATTDVAFAAGDTGYGAGTRMYLFDCLAKHGSTLAYLFAAGSTIVEFPGSTVDYPNLNGSSITNLAFPVTTWFTNQGATSTYTIPKGARSLVIRGVGHGGPGGSGKRGAALSIRSGGAGGGGGAFAELFVGDVSTLWDTYLSIVIPAVKNGGASVTADDTNGNSGESAENTLVYCGPVAGSNQILRISGGAPGGGGDADGTSGGAGGSVGTAAGSAGGASSATGSTGSAGTQLNLGVSGSGGGAGGGISNADVPAAGGAGALGPLMTHVTAAAAPAGIVGANGTNYNSSWRANILIGLLVGWPGAGGGGGQTNAPAGSGADGYGWGSGGGGGGASLNGYASGAGGAGGPSAVAVTAY